MLLHDNCIFCVVKLKAVVEFHCIVKFTNSILIFKCIFVMAESDKTLMKDENFSNNNRKSSTPSIVPFSSGALLINQSILPNAVMSEPSTLKRKQTSFQITSVTVKGSRLSTDGGEDSADDLDESHTEDASSDILDCSRTTDFDNDQLSEDNTNNTTNNDDASMPAPSIPLESKVHLPIKKIAQNNALLFPSDSSQIDKLDIPLENSQHVKPPTLPDQWQHRFRVVKIVSSVPFKRGRWLCMDFMDPPAPVVEAKPESIDSSISSGILPESIPADRVAHVYEIPPGDAYPGTLSMVIRPDERLQPMYGIFLPISNGQYPLITGMNSKPIATPIHNEAKSHESTQSIPSTQNIQHQTNVSVTQSSTQVVQQQKIVSGIQSVSTQGPQQQNVSNTQPTTQSFQQQNISNNQPIVSTQGLSHQANISVVQPTVTSSLSPVSNQGLQTSVSNIQPTVTNLGSSTQLTQPAQGNQSVVSNVQSVQAIQQSASVTQPVISTQGIQSNVVGSQPLSNQGIQQSQSVSVVQPTVSSQGIQHSQNITGIQSTISIPGLQQPKESAGGTCVDNKQSGNQTTQGMLNVVPHKQELISQPVPAMQSSTPPQSETSVQIVSNTAIPQQIVTNESVVSHLISTSVGQIQSQPAQESQPIIQPHMQILSSNSQTVPPTSQIAVDSTSQLVISPAKAVDMSQPLTQEPVIQPPIQLTVASIPTIGTQTAVVNTPEASISCNSQDSVVPSQIIPNHVEVKELGTPPSTTAQEDVPSTKSEINGEELESVPSGTSTVAIDNKIEQAMDLVKSHLMFAVREEVDVLKEKITELMDRISQLEYENGFLRANASQQTLEQLNQTQLLQQQQQQQQQQQNQSPIVNSIQQISQQSSLQPQLNIQDQQPTS